jgi:predicted lysophospholipase L1 biosynthesis ABC-type transport system permease subunit
MEKIDWKRKLSSRKFWFAVAMFIVAIFAFLNMDMDVEKTKALIIAAGTVVAYIVGEGFADGMNKKE